MLLVMYVAAFSTSYDRIKLYKEALAPLGENIIYMDTDSVINVSPDGQSLIPIDTDTG